MRLSGEGRAAVVFYSNSNLATEAEFELRLDSVRRLAAHFSLPLEVDPYDHAAWREAIKGFENEPERGSRCTRCFHFSLARTANRATELGLPFATTLTVSPHKPSRTLFEVGSAWPHFEPIDFKKQNGFRQGRELARLQSFYLQNFCGCEYSLR